MEQREASLKEKRLHKRLRVLNSSVICRGNESNKLYLSTICDLSESGMGFFTRADIGIGSELRFDFRLPRNTIQSMGSDKDNVEVHGIGDVVWVNSLTDVFGEPLTRCGIKFKNLPPTSVRAIRSFIKVESKK